MKPYLLLAGSLILVSASAQTMPAFSDPDPLPVNPTSVAADTTASELPYEELMKLGEAKLVPQGDSKITYEGAAILFFYRASKVAPDDGKKLEALLRMGQTQQVTKQYPSAMESFKNALALKNISTGQRVRAEFGLTDAEFSSLRLGNKLAPRADALRAAFEKVLDSAELPAPLRIKSYEAIAEIQASKGAYLQAAQTLRELLALPELPAARKPLLFSRAFSALKIARIDAAVPALTNTLYAQYLPLLTTPEAMAAAQSNWAEILGAQKDYVNAINKWEEVVAGSSNPLGLRALALRNINIAQRSLKNYPAALAAADRQSTLPGATPHMLAWRAWDRAAVFIAQGNEEMARSEWVAFAQLPQALAADKVLAWKEVATSYKTSLKTLAPGASNDTRSEWEKGYKNACQNAWKTEGAPINTRTQALLDCAQFEMDAKNNKSALEIVKTALKEAESMRVSPAESAQVNRSLLLALAKVYRSDKQYTLALTALITAQQQGSKDAASTALALSEETFAAKDWDATRAVLLALKNVWGLSEKSYQFNLVQVEVGAQKWDAARKALAAFDAQKPTEAENKTISKLRAQIPAA